MPFMTLFDTHCHLGDPPLDRDVGAVLAAARVCGVTRLLVPAVDERSSRRAIDLAARHDGVLAAVGWHPAFLPDGGVDLAFLEAMVATGRVCAIGEVGLDRIKAREGFVVQEAAFAAQLAFAATHALPVVIHCRNAFARAVELIEATGRPSLRGVFHAFAGSWEIAERLGHLGFLFGVGGSITRTEATRLRSVVSRIPLDHLVLETDAPYIGTATTTRGTVTPAHLPEVLATLAELKGCAPEMVAEVTTRNAERVFGSTGATQ